MTKKRIGVLFVHGTGVRQEYYLSEIYPKFQNNLKNYSKESEHNFEPIDCYWAENYPFEDIKDFVEGRKEIFDYPSDTDEGGQKALWQYLFQDPLYELRNYNVPNLPGAIRHSLKSIDTDDDKLKELLNQVNINPEIFEQAQKLIIGSTEELGLQSEATTEVARAIVAKAISLDKDKSDPFINHLNAWKMFGIWQEKPPLAKLSELVEEIKGQLSTFATPLFFATEKTKEGIAKNINNQFNFIPFLGDIVRYQGKRWGEKMRAKIYQKIKYVLTKSNKPVDELVIVAHSLGGIVVLDTLLENIAEQSILKRIKLVTVGTQVGLLWGIDGFTNHSKEMLSSKEYLDKLPFWVNIYDKKDLLAFPVNPAFASVEDYVVNNPPDFYGMVHGQYWENRDVYKIITELV